MNKLKQKGLLHRLREQLLVSGKVTLTGDATPADTSVEVDSRSVGISSVERTGPGLFQVNFDEKYAAFVSSQLTLEMPTSADFQVQLVSTDSANKQATFRLHTAGTEADLADAQEATVNMSFFFHNSRVK